MIEYNKNKLTLLVLFIVSILLSISWIFVSYNSLPELVSKLFLQTMVDDVRKITGVANIYINQNIIQAEAVDSNQSSKYKQTISDINVGQGPIGIAVNNKTNMIYVANEKSNFVSVINGTTNHVTANVTVGQIKHRVGERGKS